MAEYRIKETPSGRLHIERKFLWFWIPAVWPSAYQTPADLVVAKPLAEGLWSTIDKCEDYLVGKASMGGSYMYDNYTGVGREALDKSRTLIRHSEAIWAVLRKVSRPWGFTHEEMDKAFDDFNKHGEKHGFYESFNHAFRLLMKPHIDALPPEVRAMLEVEKRTL